MNSREITYPIEELKNMIACADTNNARTDVVHAIEKYLAKNKIRLAELKELGLEVNMSGREGKYHGPVHIIHQIRRQLDRICPPLRKNEDDLDLRFDEVESIDGLTDVVEYIDEVFLPPDE